MRAATVKDLKPISQTDYLAMIKRNTAVSAVKRQIENLRELYGEDAVNEAIWQDSNDREIIWEK